MLFNYFFNVVKIIFLNENLRWNEDLYRKIIQNFIRFYKEFKLYRIFNTTYDVNVL